MAEQGRQDARVGADVHDHEHRRLAGGRQRGDNLAEWR